MQHFWENNLDALMLQGPFACVIAIYDESGGVYKRLECEDAEIASYSATAATPSILYTSIQLEVKTIRFDGVSARTKREGKEENHGGTA